jgi:hypothetical protein
MKPALCFFYDGPQDGARNHLGPEEAFLFIDPPNHVAALYVRTSEEHVIPVRYDFRGYQQQECPV